MRVKKAKYSNQITNGYHSKKESKRAGILKLLEKAGEIQDLKEQVVFILAPAYYVQGINGKPVCVLREVKYIADFVYIKNGQQIVEDSKGFRTKEYKKKKRLMKSILGIEILET
jgi:hypothetical protein